MVDTSTVGKNVTIAAGANICAHVTIEDSAIVNTGAIIDHESHIQKASHIFPGVRIAGHVVVRPYAFVGIGATIIQGISICEAAIVGAGAVVLEDVPPYATVVGVPAKRIIPPKSSDKQNDCKYSTTAIFREQHFPNISPIPQKY
jgi:acetyltransferase-like isoleucine patch superfamily enzyme